MHMTGAEDPDAGLVAALRAGSFPEAQIADLIGRVKSYIWSEHEPMRQEADALAGRAVLIAYERIETYKGASAFLTWVIGIAKKLILKTVDEWKTAPSTFSIDADTDEARRELGEHAMRLHRESDEDQLVAWEIRGAVDELPEEDREIFRLRVDEGLPSSEVAERVGRSDENVRQTHSRNCRKIRERLQSCGWQDYRKRPNKVVPSVVPNVAVLHGADEVRP